MPHRYVVGSEGGRALVIVPPDLEQYFWRVSALLETGAVPLDQEFTIAAEHGQEFQGRAGHWGGREWRGGDPNGLGACPMIHVVS